MSALYGKFISVAVVFDIILFKMANNQAQVHENVVVRTTGHFTYTHDGHECYEWYFGISELCFFFSINGCTADTLNDFKQELSAQV